MNGCNSNDPGAPCFAQMLDILGGKKHLLRVDDLVFPVAIGANPLTSAALLMRTSDSAVTSAVTSNTNLPLPANGVGPVTAVGRMFNLANDIVATVTMGNSGSGALSLNIVDPVKGTTIAQEIAAAPACPFQDFPTAAVFADFNGDGYGDLLVGWCLSLRIITATDVSDMSQGLTLGPVEDANSSNDLAVGDFNGDGQPEIAQMDQGGFVVLRTVTVDVNNPRIVSIGGAAARIIFPGGGVAFNNQLTAGRFGSTSHDQLLAALGQSNAPNGPQATLYSVDFDASLKPAVKDSTTLGNPGTYNLVRSGRLSWFSPFDQVVALNSQDTTVVVLGFDQNLNINILGGGGFAGLCSDTIGLAVGGFDNLQPNPNPPPPTQQNPNLQVASLCGSLLRIFNLNPQQDGSYQPTVASSFTVPFQPLPSDGNNPAVNSLVPGDLQGRSLPLGNPEKATVTSHIQPDTILGVPPMHVDWITPAGGSAPEVLNVSVFPSSFNTQYNFQDTTGTQASRKSTTSYTVATKESAEEKISYGIPGLASVSFDLKQAATQTHQDSVAKSYNTYQGNAFKLAAQTVFDDRVAATANQFNIYSYPVLGQCVPAGGASPLDGCPAGTAPLHVQFSGPDNVVYIDLAEGAAAEWYQPVQEPGNVFSYPGSLGLLQAIQSPSTPLQLQSAGNDFWDSQSPEQVSISWTQGGGQDVTSGSVSTHAFDASVSVSGSVNIEGFGLMASAGFDYNQSQSVSTLNTAASTYAASTGVTVNRGVPGGPISSSNYLYQGQSFIFGQTAPTGTIQSDLSTNTNVQAQGFLSVGFATDPLSTGTIQSGDWWKQAYTAAPDVALNHPQRWLQKEPTGTNPQQVWFNCPVGFTSSPASPACAPVQQAPTPANVADALFYQMKGLFVTPGTMPGGPQITMTTRGQTVTLQARVYNYSLANMPEGATVHVQFYAQPWDATTGQFQSQAGNPDAFAPAVLIGEDQLEPIPAFCGGSQGDVDPCADESPPQNWVFAETSWDTGTVSADTYWKFWVVAWMEQGGQLVQEIGDHGLKSIPASPLNSLADVPVETYSNNLGFYNQTFSVVSAASASGSRVNAQAPATDQASVLVIDDIKAPPGSARLHQPIMVRASHRSDAGPGFDSILSLFYDGDPEKGGVLFDQEIIPGIRAGESFVAPASFQPGTCGKHRLYVQSIPGDGSAVPVTKAATVRVTADLRAELDSLGRAIKAAKLKRGKELRLLVQVKAVRKLLERGRDEAARYLWWT